MTSYVEPGGSWRPVLLAVGAGGLLVVLALLPGVGLPSLVWTLVASGIVGTVGHTLMARRVWTVRMKDRQLSVGRERVPLADLDVAFLREGTGGVDAGAPVLGGSGSLPRGRTGLPVRLTGGRTVLVPTRDPAALRGALLSAATHSA